MQSHVRSGLLVYVGEPDCSSMLCPDSVINFAVRLSDVLLLALIDLSLTLYLFQRLLKPEA